MISDVHLGKIHHFRLNGYPLPSKASENNYLRLERLIKTWSPERVIFLGDLFHSKINQDWYIFESFVLSYPDISFELIKGNHDILDEALFTKVFDTVYQEECILGPFRLTHDILPSPNFYNICGHIHPAVRIKGKGLQSIRLPCFYFTKEYAILPAFGVFTGSFTISPSKDDRTYIIADNEVIQFG